MKTKILSFAGVLLLFFCSNVIGQEVAEKNATPQKETLTISCTPDLYAMASQWVIEYNRVNPDVRIEVINRTGKNIDQVADENLSFVSNKSRAAILNETNWEVVVGRDVIVPFINAGNPYLNELLKQGVSQEKFARLFNNTDMQKWGTLVTDGQNAALHIYMVNDETVMAGVAKFLQSNQVPVAGISIGNKLEVVSAVQNDPYAIGFSNVIDIMGIGNQGLTENIRLLPVDKNGNGTIDYMENIYSDVNTFLRGVWIGKYPKSLYSNIYAVSKVQPTNETEMAFLAWVLTDGQQFMISNGYCALINTESQAQLNKFNPAIVNVTSANDASVNRLVLLILAIVFIIGFVVISARVRRYRKQEKVIPDFNDSLPGFNENSVEVPKGIYFNKSHSWAFMEKDGNVSIGIDDFLQHVTGPLTRVEMRNPGEKVKKGEFLCSIVQSGKRLSLYSPISGIIKQQNETLKEDASRINSSPYFDGWIYRIEPSNWFVEVNFMHMADKYKKWINTEFSRIKDFLAATLKPESLEYSHAVLQDGGIVKEGVLADFGPEVWDDFQTNFLEIYK